eukprot:682305-Alexandrium_andersonii.AAC.1
MPPLRRLSAPDAKELIASHVRHGGAFHWHPRPDPCSVRARVTLHATARYPALSLEFPNGPAALI